MSWGRGGGSSDDLALADQRSHAIEKLEIWCRLTIEDKEIAGIILGTQISIGNCPFKKV